MEKKILVVVVYDIVEDKRRKNLVKFLEGFGFRVQKSVFEARIRIKIYNKLKKDIHKFAQGEDKIKIYCIKGESEVISIGEDIKIDDDILVL